MLKQAQVQSIYRWIIAGFMALVGLVLGGAFYASSASTTIVVQLHLNDVTAEFSVTVSPAPVDANGLTGQITVAEMAETATAAPSAVGVSEPAQARGQVVIHNDGASSQPLATGTRLQADSGVIVRTTNRVDVPAHGTVTVEAVADPVGTEGEIPPGRLIIVALRPGNQAIIYGQVEQAFTGGTVTKPGTLALDDLTAASNQAREKIIAALDDDRPGLIHLTEPLAVKSEPAPETPSDSYLVTVTIKVVTIAYDQAALDDLVTARLSEQLADDQELCATDDPIITPGTQPTADSVTLNIAATGRSRVSASSDLLTATAYVGLDRAAITTKLIGSKQIDQVTIHISPWWRQTAADQADRIKITIGPD